MKIFILLVFIVCVISCSPSKQIEKSAEKNVMKDPSLQNAHVGISIYDPSTSKYLYNYQGDKYFVPASNIKIPICYAAMKYLGDSLVGARVNERWDGVSVHGTADPSFLHPDFKYQPVFEYLQSKKGSKVYLIRNTDSNYSRVNTFLKYGPGWSWGDYDEDYMPERTFFPIYGNVARFSINDSGNIKVIPGYFLKNVWFLKKDTVNLSIIREMEGNSFIAKGSKKRKPTCCNTFQNK